MFGFRIYKTDTESLKYKAVFLLIYGTAKINSL